jgi:hypothetical protein
VNIKKTKDELSSPLSSTQGKSPARKKTPVGGNSSVQKMKVTTACPSDEDLSAYVDGVADGEVHAQITAHLNQCPTCYQQWLDISEVINSFQKP